MHGMEEARHGMNPPAELQALGLRSRRIRATVLRMAHAGRTPHVASALSVVDLLTGLYFSALRVDPRTPEDPARDRFILSKGHAAMAHYAALRERGFLDDALLGEYAVDGGRLAEHPGPECAPGIDAATGSLGHGLSMGAGLALAGKLRGADYRVFVLVGDGECNEGSVWEAAVFAARYALDNLVVIVDYNKWSAMGRTDSFLEPLADKWKAFGWRALEIDGHDPCSIRQTLDGVPFELRRPSAVIAHTTKGKGVSFMENDLEWHYRPPSADDLRRALEEVEEPGSPASVPV